MTAISNPTQITYRLDHIMIRVMNLENSLNFYRDVLGMHVLRSTDYESGQFTNVFLSFNPDSESCLELTYNWNQQEPYSKGQNFGHLALMVSDVEDAVRELENKRVKIKTHPKKMAHGNRIIAFILDPDENLIELVQPIS